MSFRYIKNASGEYACPHCDKTAVNQSTMYHHIEDTHGDSPKYSCDHCDKGFSQRTSWLRHLANKHPETPHPEGEVNPYVDQWFSCPTCDREPMRTKQGLYVHYVRTHCKQVPDYESGAGCTSCQKLHNSAGAYLYHVPKCFGLVIESGIGDSVHKETTNRVDSMVSDRREPEKQHHLKVATLGVFP